MKPWEKYSQPAAAPESPAGPWSKYAASARGPAPSPVDEMSGGQRFLAGVGMGMTRMARGVGQAVGAVDQADIDRAHELEAPLDATWAGKAGNIAGMVAGLLPTAFIPGANTVAGAAAIGAGSAALTAEGDLKTRATAAAGGAIGGAGGVAAGRAVAAGSRALGGRAAAAGATNAVTNATIRNAVRDGYRLPPSEMVQSGLGRFAARSAESLGGKAATSHVALRANQQATNNLIRRDLGLRGRGQISRNDIDQALSPHLLTYRQAGAVSPRARQALHDWRQANGQARRYTREYNTNYTVAAEDAAIAARQEAAQHLSVIEQEATAAGRRDLARQLQRSRVELGRIGSIEDAINEDTGNVSATVLARMLERGVPLTGGSERAARFARAFPDYARPPKSQPGVSKLDAWTAAGGLASVPVTGAAGLGVAALPLASYGARHAVLSRPIQAMAAPSANPGATRVSLAAALEADPALRALGLGGNATGRRSS